MGLINNQRGGATTFLQFNGKTGKMVQTIINEGQKEKVEHDGLIGFVADIAAKDDEFEGQPVKKVLLRMVDEDGSKYQVELNAGTRFASELMARLNNADVSQPVLVRGYMLEKGSEMKFADGSTGVREHDYVGIAIRQGAEFETMIKPNYGETGEKRPEAPTVTKKDRATGQTIEKVDAEEAKVQNVEITYGLGGVVNDRVRALRAGQQQSTGNADDGIGADEAAAAANSARHRQAA